MKSSGGHEEVPLNGGAKLILIERNGEIFLRLRALVEGEWKFLTPPLLLASPMLNGLVRDDLDEGNGFPVVLEHSSMDGKVNLLRYRGLIHVHFAKRQMSGKDVDFRRAFLALPH